MSDIAGLQLFDDYLQASIKQAKIEAIDSVMRDVGDYLVEAGYEEDDVKEMENIFNKHIVEIKGENK